MTLCSAATIQDITLASTKTTTIRSISVPNLSTLSINVHSFSPLCNRTSQSLEFNSAHCAKYYIRVSFTAYFSLWFDLQRHIIPGQLVRIRQLIEQAITDIKTNVELINSKSV